MRMLLLPLLAAISTPALAQDYGGAGLTIHQAFVPYTLPSWAGGADVAAPGLMNCIGGVGAAMVGKAERALAHVDGLVLTEWLGSPAQIEFLSRKFCFQTDGAGRSPARHRNAPGRRAAPTRYGLRCDR